MTLAFSYYCAVVFTLGGFYQLPYFEVIDGVKQYPKFFSSINTWTGEVQDGSIKNLNYTYPSTYFEHEDNYCDNVVNCEPSTWPTIVMSKIYDNYTVFNFTLRYVDDNGDQSRRKATLTPSAAVQVTEPIFATFEGRFHCPSKYEYEYFRKIFTVTKPDGELFNEYTTYINFTLYTTKIGCAGSCDKNTLNIRDYSPFENQFDEPILPIPEEPEQTESENSE